MEKILLNFDEAGYNKLLAGLNKAKQKANTLLSEFRTICSFEFNNDTLQDIYQGNGERTANTLEKKVREELSKAGITSDTIIKTAVTGDLEKYYIMFNGKQVIESEYLPYLFIDEGQVCIKENTNEQVKEAFSNYIRTERGKIIYDKQRAVIDALNDFISFVPNANWLNINSFIGNHIGNNGAASAPLIRYDDF